mgnify:CR=1 FL=1
MDGYEPGASSATIYPGRNSVLITLKRGTAVRLIVKNGDRQFAPDLDREYEIVGVSGNGVPGASEWGNGATLIQVSEPGSYRIKLKTPIPGYVMPAEQIVELKRGTTTEVVFQLTGKP